MPASAGDQSAAVIDSSQPASRNAASKPDLQAKPAKSSPKRDEDEHEIVEVIEPQQYGFHRRSEPEVSLRLAEKSGRLAAASAEVLGFFVPPGGFHRPCNPFQTADGILVEFALGAIFCVHCSKI